MKAAPAKTILRLTEYKPVHFPGKTITPALEKVLWQNYRSQVVVERPSWKTDEQWELTAKGWVGYIPLTPDLGLALMPKVELENLFRMLEYAYRLRSFQFLEGLVECQSLEEFYEYLANVLARRVLDRGRKGFYRAYLPEHEQLPYVRGRLDVRRTVRAPWDVKLECHYEEHTSDIEENQILIWTLLHITRSGMHIERVLPTVRRAYRALQGFASVQPFGPRDCIGRLYNRLNDDYHPLHALCRFFLEHSGPSHEMGERTVLPFLVNMERLFELFVAEWLKLHLPSRLSLKAQEKVVIGKGTGLRYAIDLVLSDAETGRAICVLDTKYKAKETPEQNDVNQVVTYAEIKGCNEAVLIYPVALANPLNAMAGKIHVQSMTFSLAGCLEEAGQAFLEQIVQVVERGQGC